MLAESLHPGSLGQKNRDNVSRASEQFVWWRMSGEET